MTNLRARLLSVSLAAGLGLTPACATTVDLEASASGGSAAHACADTSSDPYNCGRCGHDCLGGACAAGACQPVVLAAHEVYPTTLTSDGTSVFWANWDWHGDADVDNTPTTLRAVDVDGTNLRTLGTAPYLPGSIHADGAAVYWYRSTIDAQPARGGVLKMDKAGGAPTILFNHTEDDAINIALGPGDVYWWPSGGSLSGSGLWKVGKDGTGAQIVGSTGGFSSPAIAIDERSVFGLLPLGSGPVRVDFDGGAVVPLADVPGAGTFLALDDTSVFFKSPQGIQRVDKQGGAAQIVVGATPVGAFVVDATSLYYVGADGLRRAAKEGGSDELLVPPPPGAPAAFDVGAPILAEDDRALYFIEREAGGMSASIVMIAK